jgi:hypothetical protein
MRELLDSLEEQLQPLDKNKKILLGVGVVVVIFTAFYFLYISGAVSDIDKKKVEIAQLDKKIEKKSPRHYFKKIETMKKRNLEKKTDLKKEQQNLFLLQNELERKKVLFVNKKGFNKFLEIVLKSSLKHSFNISDLTIENFEHKPYIGKLAIKKEVVLKGNAYFLNSLAFIRDLEDNAILLSIKNFNIEINGTVPSNNITIEFYGVDQ